MDIRQSYDSPPAPAPSTLPPSWSTSLWTGTCSIASPDLFGAAVSLDFRFHRPAAIVDALESNGFAVIERSEREPYDGVEHRSRRCYLLARSS